MFLQRSLCFFIPHAFSTRLALVLGSMLLGSMAIVLNCQVAAQAQGAPKFEANYDEAKVSHPSLPPILESISSDPRRNALAWSVRREVLLKSFTNEMFGHGPTEQAELTWKVTEEGDAFDGKARRRQIRVTLTTAAASVPIELLLYTPAKSTGKVPVFLGLNFGGNHTTTTDPKIAVTNSWVRNDNASGITNNRTRESLRGTGAERWPYEYVVSAGMGVATAYYGDIDPDFDDGFNNGVHALFPSHRPDKTHPDRWGTIAGWAWGLSRLLDVLQALPDIDGAKVIVHGHSRLGKTSLWAGATDTRFAAVISNNSGCGGAALSRRVFGETVERINTSFPHWFCGNYRQYNLRENDLPTDQHQLLALIAPRPLYVASASEDLWADPRGEFLSALHASELYVALGKQGLAIRSFPGPNVSSIGTVSYHLRKGKHDIILWDWERYVQFAKQELAIE